MRYYETHHLNGEERKECEDKGLFCYDLRHSDDGCEIACIEKHVLVNRCGSMITNEELPLGEKYPCNYIDYEEFTKENERVESLDELLFEYYRPKEIIKLLKKKQGLVYVDDGIDEKVIRYEDIPDFVVDVSRRINFSNFTIYDFFNLDELKPILQTNGLYLDKCDPEVRKELIDRLVKLQLYEEPIKNYKVMNEQTIEEAKKIMNAEKESKKQKNKKERDDR